jgi:hypothetical protein
MSIRMSSVAVLGAGTLALSLGAAAVPAFSQSGSSAAAQPVTVQLREPEDLPVGDTPRVAYLERYSPTGSIYRPDKVPLSVENVHHPVQHLLRVRGGYIVTISDHRVRFVGADGTLRDLVRARSPRFVKRAVASRGGRFVAVTTYTVDKPRYRLVVRRISTNELVARRTFHSPAVVASLTGHRALLTTGTFNNTRRSDLPPMLTRWWDLRTGRLRLIDDAGRPGGAYPYQNSPGDLTAGQVALMRGDHHRVVTIPRRPARAWRTRSHEWVHSWSPDDRYVLTETGHTYPHSSGWDTMRIRRARDGAVVTKFQGWHNLDVDDDSPTWETPSTFVFTAEYNCGYSDDDEDAGWISCSSSVTVRCTVHGVCEQMALPVGALQIDERQLPPS